MSNIHIFDLDGTLVDSMKYFSKAILSIADDEGLEYDDTLLKTLTPLGYRKSAEYYVKVLGVKESVDTIVQRIGERLYYEYANNILVKKYVREYLEKLSSEGSRLFVLTASPHLVTDVCLKHNGIFDLFEKVWSVDDFGLSKASPELFYKVAETIGCKPSEIHYFDDSLVALENAKKAGYVTYGVYDAQSADEICRMKNELADVLVMDYTELFPKKHKLTMVGNNIFQNFILENKYNTDAPFAIKPTARFNGLMGSYSHYLPDIIALQECDEGWHDMLDSPDGLPSLGYAAATDGFTDESLRMIRNVIYYKKDRLEPETGGYEMYEGTSHGALANPWCYSWAILKDKLTGARFAVTSTHFVWVSIDNWAMRDKFAHQLSGFIAALEEKYSVPVIAMGDYNAHPLEPAYSTMKTGLLSAREVALEKINMEYKTCTRVGRAPALDEDGMGAVDHCFISKEGVIPCKYELLINPMTYAYSDHVPQRLTFEIKS